MVFMTLQLALVIILLYWKPSESCIYCPPTRPRTTPRPPLPPPITTIAPRPPTTTPVDVIIEPVINPNSNDEPPRFTATIATPNEEPVCAATLISLHFVLSSCIRCLQKNGRPVGRDRVIVLVGDLDDNDFNGLGLTRYEAETVVLHPDCLRNGRYDLTHDVGIIKTATEISSSMNIQFATIPEKKGYRPNLSKNWMVATFRPRQTHAVTLKECIWYVKVRNVPSRICQMVLNSTFYDPRNSYCTPYQHAGRTDNCWDDYGAPLSLDNILIGILIHKFSCGRINSAGSFVNIAYNSPWIREAVQRLSDQKESV